VLPRKESINERWPSGPRSSYSYVLNSADRLKAANDYNNGAWLKLIENGF
jgi:hypothetical protein